MDKELKQRLTSRKFLGTVWLHVLSDIFLLTAVMDAGQWVEFNTFLLGIYVSGNAISKFGEAGKEMARKQPEPYKVNNN
jgi:hypothetical protein